MNNIIIDNDDFLMDLLGDIEELNAFIGNINEIHLEFLNNIQIWLFDLQTLIRNPEKKYIFDVNLEYTKKIEDTIDNMKSKLPILKGFILPKGNINISRIVCKKVERKLIAATKKYSHIDNNSIVFINRLSDYLFQLSRYAHFIINKKEIIYNKSDILTLTNDFEDMKL
jgi:cob(I)alamin adenosyltransferase